MTVAIPPVIGIGVIGVEFEPIAIPVQIENVRIAVAVGNVYSTIYATALVIVRNEDLS